MSQILKLETCPENGCPTCRVYNMVQRRIGIDNVSDPTKIKDMSAYAEKERCPEGQHLDQSQLHPARTKRWPQVW